MRVICPYVCLFHVPVVEMNNIQYTHPYVAGAKDALNHRGFDDLMVYYTLLAMDVPVKYIYHIGKDEREKRVNRVKSKLN